MGVLMKETDEEKVTGRFCVKEGNLDGQRVVDFV